MSPTDVSRDSTQSKANQRKSTNNKTGFRGVHMSRGRFFARAHINGVYKHLGMFDTAEEASAAYQQAATALYRGVHEP